MALDASIYSNIKPVQIDLPSPMDAAGKALSLGNLGLQQQQMQLQNLQLQRQYDLQNATRAAFLKNTDQSGNLNRQGVLSDIGKVNPQGAMELQNQFLSQDKAQADARKAQAEAAQTALTNVIPRMDYLAGLPEDQRAAAYPNIRAQLASEGVDVSKMPDQYDHNLFSSAYAQLQTSKPKIEQIAKQAEIEKTRAGTQQDIANTGKVPYEIAKLKSDIGQAPAKLNSELYGSRSPYATQQDAYSKEAAPVRSSQDAMKQMIDNYNHPSPQGYASLKLNAFKIKFPNAPDVNSLEELSKAQGVTDQMKAWVNQHASGMDQTTMDNLMRDAISTYRSKVEGLKDTQQKYRDIARQNNLPNANFTVEPAIDNTYKDALTLQDKIGPYVPPTERGGIAAGIGKSISNLFNSGGPSNATAAPQKKASDTQKQEQMFRKVGAQVSADELAQYATKHNMKLSDAKQYLTERGYVINR